MLKKITVVSILVFLLCILTPVLSSFVLRNSAHDVRAQISTTLSVDQGIQKIAEQIYHNESFLRVRGSSSVQSQTHGSSMVVEHQDKKYILTNFHVIHSMIELYVEELKTGNVYTSRVIGRDPVLDLALLELPKELAHLAPVAFADFIIGEIVFAIGFPFGERAVTIGFITATKLISSMFLLSQVPLNPGNSGGPLLNIKQQVVGVNTAYRPNANLYSFSIPSLYVQKILPQLAEGGTIRHAYPKLHVVDFRNLLPRNFADMGIPYPLKQPGLVVVGFQDEAASQQGIEIGDVILSIDGVRTETIGQYVQLLMFSYKSGQRAKFVVLRGTEEVNIELKLSVFAPEQQ